MFFVCGIIMLWIILLLDILKICNYFELKYIIIYEFVYIK